MSYNKVSRVLFKSLFKTCKRYDQYPQIKALFTRPQERHSVHPEISQKIYSQIFRNSNGYYYIPTISFTKIAKEQFKKNRDVSGERLDKLLDVGFYFLRELSTHMSENQENMPGYIEKNLSKDESNNNKNNEENKKESISHDNIIVEEEEGNKEERNKEESSTPTEKTNYEDQVMIEGIKVVDKPSVGKLLISHPMNRAAIFENSITLITDYEKTFVRGIVLNQKFDTRSSPNYRSVLSSDESSSDDSDAEIEISLKGNIFEEETTDESESEESETDEEERATEDFRRLRTSQIKVGEVAEGNEGYKLSEFIDCVVCPAGPVPTSKLAFIHSHPEVKGSAKVHVDGLYFGGDIESANQLVKEKKLATDDFQFFTGESKWTSKQLKHELNEGVWFIVDISNMKTFLKSIRDVPSGDAYRACLKKLGGEYASFATIKF